MAVCPSCGAPVSEGTRFCSECGAKIELAAAPAAPIAEEIPAAPIAENDAPVFAAPPVSASVPTAEPVPAPVQPASGYEYAQEKPEPSYPGQVPAAEPDKPGKKSKFAPMTSWGMAIEWLLMSIPAVGFILMIVWACGGCRKIARRNLARAYLILLIIGLVLLIVGALLARFAFKDAITAFIEAVLPGYTLQWG